MLVQHQMRSESKEEGRKAISGRTLTLITAEAETIRKRAASIAKTGCVARRRTISPTTFSLVNQLPKRERIGTKSKVDRQRSDVDASTEQAKVIYHTVITVRDRIVEQYIFLCISLVQLCNQLLSVHERTCQQFL